MNSTVLDEISGALYGLYGPEGITCEEVEDAVNGAAEEEEMGARVGRKKSMTRVAAAAAGKLQNKAAQKKGALMLSTSSRGKKELLSQFDRLDAPTRAAMANGKGKLRPQTFYRRHNLGSTLGANSQVKLWDSTNQLVQGLSNLNGAQMPDKSPFLVQRIGFRYAIANATGGPSVGNNNGADVANAVYTNIARQTGTAQGAPVTLDVIPPGLLNSMVALMVENQQIFEVPLSRFFIDSPDALRNYPHGLADLWELPDAFLLAPNRTFEWLLRTPDSTNALVPAPVFNPVGPVAGVYVLELEMEGQVIYADPQS